VIPAIEDIVDGYHVFCTDQGIYCLATRKVFGSRTEAHVYAKTVSPSRNPIVIPRREVIRAALNSRRES